MSEREAYGLGPKQIAYIGTKGGVGTSVFAANTALSLASLGKRVAVVDADVDGAALHNQLGVERPEPAGALAVFYDGNSWARAQPWVKQHSAHLVTPYKGVELVVSGFDTYGANNVGPAQIAALRAALSTLPVDYIVIDFGDSIRRDLMDWFSTVDLGVIVATPEPSAVERFYQLLTVDFFVRVKHECSVAFDDALLSHGRHLPAPKRWLDELRVANAAATVGVEGLLERPGPYFVVTQIRTRSEANSGNALCCVSRYALGRRPVCLGEIQFDEFARASVARRKPLLYDSPGCRLSRGIEKVVRRLISGHGRMRERAISQVGIPSGSYHDVLEVGRDASDDEIRRAHDRMREIFAEDNPYVHGALNYGERETLRKQLQEAYDTLIHSERRVAYEAQVFGDKRSEAEHAGSARPTPVVDPAAVPRAVRDASEYSGDLLRQTREALGLDLDTIARYTRIGMHYLKAIEDENFEQLPAAVYVRGFVAQYCRCLTLDATRAAESYMRRFESVSEAV